MKVFSILGCEDWFHEWMDTMFERRPSVPGNEHWPTWWVDKSEETFLGVDEEAFYFYNGRKVEDSVFNAGSFGIEDTS